MPRLQHAPHIRTRLVSFFALCILVPPAASSFGAEVAVKQAPTEAASSGKAVPQPKMMEPDIGGADPLALPTHSSAPSGETAAVTDPATGAELPPLNLLPPPTPQPEPPPLESPSQNVTINLINRLVQKGVLTHADADELIKMAAADAARAREEAAANDAMRITDDTVRVTYVPESVKSQIRDEIKTEVLAQAKAEGWAAPNQVADWTRSIRWFGDVRVRYEVIDYPTGNDNTGAFPNFNAINTGDPFDVSGNLFSPQHNVDQERHRERIRARIGIDVNLEDGFTAGLRLATGDSNTPVSPNQTLGVANQGQGGNFSKYAIWLDRAFIKYELADTPEPSPPPPALPYDPKNPAPAPLPPSVEPRDLDRRLAITMGRFDNPWFVNSMMMWDEDVGFDGVVFQASYELAWGIVPSITAGAFPIFNTDLNFASNQPAKFESTDKYLYAGEAAVEWKPNRDFRAKFAAAYYDFDNIEGRLSDPYTPLSSEDAGNTDNTRPSYAQKGNTYMALRNIIPSELNDYGTSNQWQYFGLATPFEVGTLTGRIDLNHFEPYQMSLIGEYAKNMAFDQEAINAVAVNNRGAIPTETVDGTDGTAQEFGDFEGGDTAWYLALILGKGKFEKRWDWNAEIGYRYIESDAVVDAFNDSDFGLGGTNMKGYHVGASIAISPKVKVGVKWFGAEEIAGPPLSSDIFFIDVSAKF